MDNIIKSRNFEFFKQSIPEVLVIQPKIYSDERGYFMETYAKRDFEVAGINLEFVQSNQSKSTKGVLRGLHYQSQHPQGKLVKVIKGEVFDVAVDIRKGSETYGKYVSQILTEDNKKMMYVPVGFAHGFLVMSDEAIFTYQTTDLYHPEFDAGIRYNDPTINIKWPEMDQLLLSDKDINLPLLKEV